MAWHVRPSMAHIALLIPDMRGGGAERVALTLVEGFLERGHQVDLVVQRAAGELLPLIPAKARVVDLGADRIRRMVRPLAAYLQRQGPDSLLAVMWPMPVVAIIAARLAGSATPVVASDHGILSEHNGRQPLQQLMLRLTTRLIYPQASRRIAASAGIADDLARISGLARSEIDVISNPIPMPPPHVAVSKQVEALWGGEGVRILNVGNLKPEKDHRLLLDAFARFARTRDARLMILGEGALRRKIELQAEELGIADRVVMPGFHADCWPFYASSDLFVLSSSSEGFGNVLVEAMAVGLPVVSTNCAGPREVLDDGAHGQLVPVGNANALAAAMSEAPAHSGNGAARKTRALQYRPELAVERYLELLVAEGAQ